MTIGQDFYGDSDLRAMETLSRAQSAQALGYGDQAARYADPFMGERGFYQNQLKNLMSDPGSFSSSPAYQFAYNEGLNALQRKGGVRSGAKMAALMKYGQDRASQLYGQQAQLLSNLAMSGSSPASAGLSYARGTERSQDYAQMAAANRYAANQRNQLQPRQQQTPWWQQPMQMPTSGSQSAGWGSGSSYGSGVPSVYDTPYVTASTPGYTPSSYAGTGYMTSDYGATVFGNGGSAYSPSSLYASDYGMPSGGYDYGYGSDYSGYDYGGDSYDYGYDYGE